MATKRKSTAKRDAIKRAKIAEEHARSESERFGPAPAALRKLDNEDFWSVVAAEVDRRRCNFVTGGTTDLPGEYTAAVTALAEVLGIGDPEHRGPGERLAEVGRGAPTKPETGSAIARELVAWLDAGVKDPGAFAATLAKRFGRPVSERKIAEALKLRRGPKQLSEIAAAAGVAITAQTAKEAIRAI